MRRPQPLCYFLLILMLPAYLAAGDYWPLVAGATFQYESAALSWINYSLRDNPAGDGTTLREGTSGPLPCSSSEAYFDDGSGDIYLPYATWQCLGDLEPTEYDFDPPLLFLDLPLAAGKTWTWNGDLNGSPSSVAFSVTGEQVITVASRTFTVMVVSVDEVSGIEWLPQELYLHRDLGPVIWLEHNLVSWTELVDTPPATWGQVKALYR
ncbi:MAG: hypothetical protein ABIF77_14320 [bacterium]